MTLTNNSFRFQSRREELLVTGLISNILYTIKRMEKNHIKLTKISKGHSSSIIKNQAAQHLAQQSKMISIAYELLDRMNTLEDQYNNNEIQESQIELIQQFTEEIDILNYMNFEVSKKHFSFIHDHFESPIVMMNFMAA